MQYLVDKNEMKNVDAYTINEIGIPSLVLMEKAALCVYQYISEKFDKNHSVLVVVEGGNNGADGLALARMLSHNGYDVTVYEIGAISKKSEEYERQMAILNKLTIRPTHTCPENEYDIIVDGIFGVGLKREVAGIHYDVIEKLNQKNGFKIAIDIPSGLDASTGEILGTVFSADATITFGAAKLGFYLTKQEVTKELIVADIGFPTQAYEHVGPRVYTYEKTDLFKLLPKRVKDSNKGTYGRVSLIAGSKDMSGAAFLSGKAAYLMGSGLVKIYTHESNREILQTNLPEAVMMTYADSDTAMANATDALAYGSIVAIGPGLSQSKEAELILKEVILKSDKPIIIDADGLNILSKNLELLAARKDNKEVTPIIITPHMKEMSRLTGLSIDEIKKDPMRVAKEFADTHQVIVVLKDANTVVSDGSEKIYFNINGNNGMSTGGSGDVLTGIISGLLASKLDPVVAATLGVYLHAAAGDIMAQKKNVYALMASDLLEGIVHVLGGK